MKMTGSSDWVAFSIMYLEYASQFTHMRSALTNLKDPNFKKMQDDAIALFLEEEDEDKKEISEEESEGGSALPRSKSST